jgi:probable rRNA maturation factor
VRRAILAALQLERAPDSEVSVLLADDEVMSRMNVRYLGREGPTDVLAFSQVQGQKVPGSKLLGDVVVSLEAAQRQARRTRCSTDEEVCLLAVHGVLHLLGWRDGTPAEQRKMMRRARQILRTVRGDP